VSIGRTGKLLAFMAAGAAKSTPSHLSTAEAERQDAEMLRRRSEHAGRNHGIIHNSYRLRRQATMSNPVAQCATAGLQKRFDRWANGNVGFEEAHGTLAAIMIRVAHALAEVGGGWLHAIQTNADDNGLRLQIWPERLREKTDIDGRKDGIRYRNGDIVSVLFRSQSPAASEQVHTQVAIPGRDLFWFRYALHAGQGAGISPSAPAFLNAHQLQEYTAVTVSGAAVRNAIPVILQRKVANSWGDQGLVKGKPFTDLDGRVIKSIKPGTIGVTGDGTEAIVPPGATQLDLSQHIERSISAGVGIPWELVGGSLGEASMSALLAAFLIAETDGIEVQEISGWFSMLSWIAKKWAQAEILAGRRANPDRVKWLQRKQGSIQPFKDAQADKLRVEMGFDTHSNVIRRSGRSPADVARERQEDIELGLSAGPAPEPEEQEQDLAA
jgi:hypothetical protein